MKRARLVATLAAVTAFGAGVMPAAGVAPGGDGMIAFTTPDFRIALIRPDGTGLVVLPEEDGAHDIEVAWSPDGARLAYVRTSTAESKIWVMDADGTNREQVTVNTRTDRCPAWSPDGTMIAFERHRPNKRASSQIRVKVIGGPAAVRITRKGSYGCPDWSPNGSKILFSSPPLNALYTIAPDGTALTQVLAWPNDFGLRWPRNFVWSPDGARIAFQEHGIRPDGGRGTEELFVMDADGTNIVDIWDDYSWDSQTRPAWSPSGDRFAYINVESGSPTTSGLWVMNVDGTNREQVTDLQHVFTGDRLSWQPIP